MARTFITLAFLVVAAVASAQERQVNFTDTPEMMAVVEKRTALVDKTTDLTVEQTAQVKEVYLKVERQFAALHFRFENSEPKMSAEDREQDMKPHYEQWDHWTNDQLTTILTPAQMTKWTAAQK